MSDLQVLHALYGDGVWEISKAMTEAQRKERNQKRLTQGLAAGNAISAVAGPAALYSAYRSHKNNTGGIPREVATGVGSKMSRSSNPRIASMGKKILKPVEALNSARGPNAVKGVPKKWKVGAGIAGGTAIGLQAINASVDGLSAATLNNAAKKKDVSKADEPVVPSSKEIKMKMLRKGTDGALYTLRKVDPAKVSAAPKQAVHKSVDVDLAIRGEVCKMNEERKQVFGWASVLEMDGKPVVDLQDDVMTIDTIEKAAYKYVHGSRKGGRQHAREGEEPLHVSDMIESFVVTPEKKEAMGLPDSVPTGWWVGFQVNDDDTWQAYKDGKLKDFSIHGSGRRVNLDV